MKIKFSLSSQKRKRDEFENGQSPSEDADFDASEIDGPAEEESSLRIKVKKPRRGRPSKNQPRDQVESSEFFNILNHLFKSDTSQIFWNEVNEKDVPGYHDVIKKPMWLLKIRDNLEQQRYTIASEVFTDLKLMFDNAKKFNPKGTFFYLETTRLEKELKKLRKHIHKNSQLVYDQVEADALPESTLDTTDAMDVDEEDDEAPYEQQDYMDEDEEEDLETPTPGATTTEPEDEEALAQKEYPKIDMTPQERLHFNNQCLEVLKALREMDDKKYFSEPMPESDTEFHDAVKYPLDFGTIQSRIDANYYQTAEHFKDQLYSIFKNMKRAKHPNTQIYRAAKNLLISSQTLMYDTFGIPTDQMIKEQNKQQRKQQRQMQEQSSAEKFMPRITVFNGFPKLKKERLQSIMKRLFERLRLEDTYHLFMNPPNPKDYPEYEQMIGFPMDFSTIEKKLNRGEIETWADFDYLLEVVFANIRHYYNKETVFYDEAVRLQNFLRTTRTRMIDKLRRNIDYPLNQLVPAYTPRNTKRLDKFRSRLSTMKHQDPALLQRLCESALYYASRLDNTRFFVNPINRSQYPDFYIRTKNPICLELVQQHLEEDKFRTFREFRQEIELVYENAINYFPEDSIHHKEATYILKYLKQRNDEYSQMLRLNESLAEPPAKVMRDYLKKKHGKNMDDVPMSRRGRRELMKASRRSTRNSRAIEEYEQEQITPDLPFTATVLRAHHTKPATSEEQPLGKISQSLVKSSLMPQLEYVTKSYTVPLKDRRMSDAEFDSLANTSLTNMFKQCKPHYVKCSLSDFMKKQRDYQQLSGDQIEENNKQLFEGFLKNQEQVHQLTSKDVELDALPEAHRNRLELERLVSETASRGDATTHQSMQEVLSELDSLTPDPFITQEIQKHSSESMKNRLKNVIREAQKGGHR